MAPTTAEQPPARRQVSTFTPVFPEGPYRAVPNLLTACVVASGCALMVASSLPNFRPIWAIAFSIIGVVADMLDGMAARRLNAKSKFGSAFDQLADLTCFGIGPAVFFIRMQLDGKAGFSVREAFCLFAGFIYMLLSVARIARELVNTNMSRPLYFTGIPTNLACPILVITSYYMPQSPLLPVVVLALGGLMISNMHIYKDLGFGYLIGYDFLNLRGQQKDS